ncbi:50S ribosomal protein L5 [Buchnera aphidicola (Tetraneura ulmi)]|uniref:50S ribosomal protein L5 n=1 Tax=Buchnera aphidicola TaxID=9 RepID=UPI003463AD8A
MIKLLELYKKTVIKKLMMDFGYKSIMEVPKIEKITLNMGVGNAILDKKLLNKSVQDLSAISGQKAIITFSKKSVAGFKIRKNVAIGCKVTLRRKMKWDFLDRLINIAFPRIRDFRGFSKNSFDGRGNYSIGIREQIIFPEIDYEKLDKIRGLDITITTTAISDDEGYALLSCFNFPFSK